MSKRMSDLIDAYRDAVSQRVAFSSPEHHAAETAAREALLGQWQPIETAPLDGTSIIVWDDPVRSEAYHDGEDGSWWLANTGRGDYTARAIYPTLWQPIPAPPSSPHAIIVEVK